jgi:hypothetical protein
MEGRILGQLKLRAPLLALGAPDPADSKGHSGFEVPGAFLPESEVQGPVKVVEFEVLPPQAEKRFGPHGGAERGRSLIKNRKP